MRVAAPVASRFARRAVSWSLCAVLLAGGTAVGPTRAVAAEPTPAVASGATPSPTAEVVKYYIVGHTGTTEREYLFQIAARTLGDGRRYMEIFELNEGRLQPDGARLEDPYVLMPGWILILPPDAEGPGVVVGPPPAFGSSSSGGSTSPAAAPSPDSGDGMIRAAALIVVLIVLVVALHLLRRGRRIELPALARATAADGPQPVTPAGDQPGPTDHSRPPARSRRKGRSATDGPATDRPPQDRPVRGRTPTDPATSGRTTGDQATSGRTASDRPAGDRTNRGWPGSPEPRRPFDGPTIPSGLPAVPTGANRPTGASPGSAVASPRSTMASPGSSGASGGSTGVPAGPAEASAGPTEPTATRVQVNLTAGQDRLTIRLIGARPGAGDAILGRGEARPPRSGGAVVQLGDAGPDALWVDLTACPDVVRITGDPAGVHRQCEAIARQLAQAGVPTVAVGDVPGVSGVVARTVAAPDQVIDGAAAAQVLIAFLADSAASGGAALHELITSRRPRVVPVVVGAGPKSRWSIDVG